MLEKFSIFIGILTAITIYFFWIFFKRILIFEIVKSSFKEYKKNYPYLYKSEMLELGIIINDYDNDIFKFP